MSSHDHNQHGGKKLPQVGGKPHTAAADHESSPGRGTQSLDHTQGVPSTIAIAGHPLHPMLIPFPIAFLIAVFGADLAAWATGDPFWARAALWLSGAGVLTAALAALVGLIEFVTIERARVHRVGWVHALGAGSIVILATLSWLLRMGNPLAATLPWALVLSALITGLLLVVGWAGGELPYRHMIGVTGHGAHEGAHSTPETAGKETNAMQMGASKAAGEHAGMKMDKTASGGASGSAKKMDKAMPGESGRPQEGMDHAAMNMAVDGPLATRATLPQKVVMAFISVLVLLAGLTLSATTTNLYLSARDVGGAIMPPGMLMLRDTPGQAMRDMSAVDPRTVSYTAPADARGDQPLLPRVENGVKVFDLDVSVIKWNILPYKQVMAYAFNRQVPGPRIRVTQGDRIRINVTNHLPEPTSVHWHGLIVPNGMDGPADITQKPIEPGQTFVYEFTTQQAGTYFYHSHKEPDRQQSLGMYGALIIDPQAPAATPAYDLEYTIQLQEWLEREGYTFPAMLMEGGLPNFFTINGKAYPSTDTIQMKVGQKIRVRFVGSSNNFIHPMHIHGGPFKIIATDGNPVPEAAQWEKDTVNVAPGERYDVIWTAREPGKWLIHCHIGHHTTNNNVEEQGGGGLTMLIEVRP